MGRVACALLGGALACNAETSRPRAPTAASSVEGAAGSRSDSVASASSASSETRAPASSSAVGASDARVGMLVRSAERVASVDALPADVPRDPPLSRISPQVAYSAYRLPGGSPATLPFAPPRLTATGALEFPVDREDLPSMACSDEPSPPYPQCWQLGVARRDLDQIQARLEYCKRKQAASRLDLWVPVQLWIGKDGRPKRIWLDAPNPSLDACLFDALSTAQFSDEHAWERVARN